MEYLADGTQLSAKPLISRLLLHPTYSQVRLSGPEKSINFSDRY